jgi:hypothetical protein
VVELPADLVFDRFLPVGISESGGFDGVGRGPERVRAHVGDGDCLTGGSGSGRCSSSLQVTRRDTAGEPTANLVRSADFSSGERAGPVDESPWAVIIWSLILEQPQNPLGAVGRPCGNEPPLGLAQRLRGSHHTR